MAAHVGLEAGIEGPAAGVSRLTQRVRAAGLCVLGLALTAAAVAVVGSARQGPGLLDQTDPQTCPPPCVPHVFSAKEESLLASGQSKGKLSLPGGDSAVEEAMKAASDANGQMTTLKAGTSDRPISEGGSDPFHKTRTVSAIIGHGGKPFVSQWDQMHGEAEADWETHAPSQQQAATSSVAAGSGDSLRTHLRASSGTLRGGDRNNDDDDSDSEESNGEGRESDDSAASSGDDDIARAGSLGQALRTLSGSRLRAIVRLLLKSRAQSSGEDGGRGGRVAELRDILNGSRQKQEEKRRLEQAELLRVRKAMDEIAYKAHRRRRERQEEEDAISALTKRLGGGNGDDADAGGEDGVRTGSLGDGERTGSLAAARLSDLYEVDDVRPRHGEILRTDRLLQLLGGGEHEERRERDVRRSGGGAELRSNRPSKVGAATRDLQRSNQAIVQELAQLAARKPFHRSK